MHLGSLGLAWPLAALAAVAAGAAPRQRGHVELELAAILPMESEAASVLVLREKRGRALLPIFMARGEARGLAERLAGKAPLADDAGEVSGALLPDAALVLRAVGALGGRVSQVELRVARRALFQAHVALAQGGRQIDLEAQPSEGVALALGAGAPLYASRELMARAALTPEDLRRMRRQARMAEEAPPRPDVQF